MVADLDVSPRQELNLCSAFAHVLADTMRTLTVMTCALLVSFGGVDALTADAVGSLVVSAIIALVAAYVLYEACVQALALRTGQPSHIDADGGALSGSGSRSGGGGSSSGRQAQSRR
jgi:Co/Zn/Cd efflux system component